MNKIYYFQQEVKIGDKIELNGHKVTVTKQLIKDLPDKFKVKSEDIPKYVECIKDIGSIRDAKWGEILKAWYDSDKSFPYRFESKYGENGYMNSESFYTFFKPSTKEAWLLQEAKRRYPKGTKFTILDNEVFTSDGKFRYNNSWSGHGDKRQTVQCAVVEDGVLDCSVWDSVSGWAEIVKPLFTTEDRVDIYEGDKCWFINSRELIKDENIDEANYGYWDGGSCDPLSKYFSTREAAEEYIAKHKEKTLKDYENELYAVTSISGYSVYSWLKDNDKKLYYTKVLQLIADDLNKHANEKSTVCTIAYVGGFSNYYGTESHTKTYSNGSIIFKNKEVAEKAIEIMGDKLNYIYKQ
jgi:hypothetical protein